MTEEKVDQPSRPRMSFGTKILIGVLAGIACGILLGDLAAPLGVAGTIYISLLQMTVLPYVTIALITKIGNLSFTEAKRLGGRAGIVTLALWAVGLALVVVIPLSLPHFETGTFFNTTLVEPPPEFDFLGLYVPTNPFFSLANNVVPAVVVFSLLLGIALIATPGKERLLDPLGTLSHALGRISNGIIRLTPLGTFFLTADVAGKVSPDELIRIAGYVYSFTLGIALLTFLVIPLLVSALTPHPYFRILGKTRSPLLTAFATGKLFAVLPMVITAVRDLLVDQEVPEEEAEARADLLVPLAYPFPNVGKIITILFIPFAAWFTGAPLSAEDYPLLLTAGLLTFFGSPLAAIPFLLGMFRLPGDLLALFLISGIWCARIGDVAGVMHLTAFAVITDAWNRGWLKVRAARLGLWLGISAAATILLLALNHVALDRSLGGQPPARDRIAALELFSTVTTIEVDEEASPNPSAIKEGETPIDRVRRTGELRVGYLKESPPFSYRKKSGAAAGLEVDLAQRLAAELGASLRLVPCTRESIESGFSQDHFDIAIGAMPLKVQGAVGYRETAPYLELHAAILVLDYRVPDFRTIRRIVALDQVRLGVVKGGLLLRPGINDIPGMEIVELSKEEAEAFVHGRREDLDAVLTTAEVGSAYAMLRPEFSVVIPEGVHVKVPIVFAVRPNAEFAALVDRWLRLKKADGTVEILYRHWVLGKSTKKQKKRWSVVRDVLGWAD